MPLVHAATASAVLLLLGVFAGCSAHRSWMTAVDLHSRSPGIAIPGSPPTSEQFSRTKGETRRVVPVSHHVEEECVVEHEEDPGTAVPGLPSNADDPFAGLEALPLPHLISEVQARNPSLHAAQAAWSAAANRYPQVVALDDPMFDVMMAPASFRSNSPVDASYTLTASQKLPWHGKRALRGEMALWEANASAWDSVEVELRLTLAASLAYFDYYIVLREMEINRSNVTLLEDIRSTAKSKYEANLVSAQDLSLADLELAKLEQRAIELAQMRRVSVARINTLLHRRPDHPLPPIPGPLTVSAGPIDVAQLQHIALQRRPELAALASRIQAEQNAVALACKEYYPDFEVLGRYDTMWADSEQRGIVGLNFNVPVYRDKRAAAVNEAMFRLGRLQAEYAQLADSVREDIETSAAKVEQARGVVELYEQRVLPAAEISLNDAKAAYVAGAFDFQRLLLARRQLADEQLGYQRALADYHRNAAELARAVGTQEQPIPPAPQAP